MEPTLIPEGGFLRFRIDLAYDGSNFSGWARQPDLRTVQGEIENALNEITQSSPELTVAGRTDAGVHATGLRGLRRADAGRGHHRQADARSDRAWLR